MKTAAHEQQAAKRQRRSMLAVQVGLAANVLLAVLKATVGILGHSPALLADGIITPSITVTSSIEGLRLYHPHIQVLPIVIVILTFLFFR